MLPHQRLSAEHSHAERALPCRRRPDQPSSTSLARKVCVQSWWLTVESVDAHAIVMEVALMDVEVVPLFSFFADVSHRRRFWLYRAVCVSRFRRPALPYTCLVCGRTFLGSVRPRNDGRQTQSFFTTATWQSCWCRVFAREELDQNPLTYLMCLTHARRWSIRAGSQSGGTDIET